MTEQVRWSGFEAVRTPTAADRVFATLYEQVVTLALPPGTAFPRSRWRGRRGCRGSRCATPSGGCRSSAFSPSGRSGRPRSAPSRRAVLQARFVRTALEVETVRIAAAGFAAEDFAALDEVIAAQAAAVAAEDRQGFHALDDEFHRRICARSGRSSPGR